MKRLGRRPLKQLVRLRTPGPGFTLIEVVVVLGIITILVALILPAVQSARESARRTQCSANLRQIGLGMQGYEATFGCLPPGRLQTYDPRYAGTSPPCSSLFVDKSFEVFILPFVEQAALYNSINEDLTIGGGENSTAHSAAVAIYACPSDATAGVPRDLAASALTPYGLADPPGGRQRMVLTSYAACTGSFEALALPLSSNHCRPDPLAVAENDGCFCDFCPIPLASITDGLSSTLFVLERATSPLLGVDAYGPDRFARHGWYVTGNWGDTLATTFYPPNAWKFVSLSVPDAQFNAASSLHPGGLQALMGDGSARFVRETIQSWTFSPITGIPIGARTTSTGAWTGTPAPGVWQALSTRAGGERPGDF